MLLGAASTVAAFALAEGVVRVFGLLAQERNEVARLAAGGDSPEARQLPFLIHPFRGRARRPGVEPRMMLENELARTFPGDRPTAWCLANSRVNLHGYRSAIEDYRTVPPDRFVVGVFGGSVANGLCFVGGDSIVEALETLRPELAGRVTLLNFGFAAYKQPQQAAALMEAILLHVPLHAVVNLDGFNELALGAEDAKAGFHPLFPARAYYGTMLDLARAAPSPERLLLAGRAVELRQRARRLAQRAATGLPSRSALLAGLAGSLCLVREREALALEAQMGELAGRGSAGDPVASLPDVRLGSGEAPWELIAEIWARGSLLMAAMSRSVGASYLHVLQPNQYVPGTKRLTEQELVAFDLASKWARVADGYPYLRRRGAELPAQGIDFLDLTDIFVNRDDTIYRDGCCHPNLEGYRILGRAIAERVAAAEASRARMGDSPAR